MNSFLGDLIRVLLSNIIIILFGLLTSIITARWIGPEGNGVIAGLAIYPSLFMTIGSLGIRQSTTYFLGKGIYPEDKIKTAITQIWFVTTVISMIICYFLMTYFSKSGFNHIWVLLSLAPIPFTLFVTYNSGIFLGKNDIKTFNKVNWIPPLIILALTLILVVVFKADVSGALIAGIGGPLFMALLMLFKNDFLKSFNLNVDLKIIKSMLSLGLVYAFSLLIINLNYKADYILLDKLSSSYELGIYSKGSAITQYLWQIPMVLSTIVFARSASSKNDKEFSYKVAQLLRLSFILIGIASLILFLLSKFIIVGMYGKEFESSTVVLNYLLPGVIILTIFKVMNMDLAGKGKPYVVIKAMIPSLIINVILNVLFIPKYGAAGSALCSTISYGFAGISFLYYYSKEVDIPISEIVKFRKTDFNPIFNVINKIKKGS
ncbi:oligosaccharide flippase family protein [Sphingobacterium siyangense]|uniref:oligosaccharide flippase family protein n=1 Tax=Sphingobacterium siyangense TaxID=459529 RepID=UPI003DA418F7